MITLKIIIVAILILTLLGMILTIFEMHKISRLMKTDKSKVHWFICLFVCLSIMMYVFTYIANSAILIFKFF